jgi:hypothetical protein
VQRFSVGIRDVWDNCVTANGDSVTFTDLLVTTDPILLQEPLLFDRLKSTRSFLGYMTLLTGSSLSTFQISYCFRPHNQIQCSFMYFVCVCVCLCWLLYGGTQWLWWLRYCATSRRSRVRFPMRSFRPHHGTGVDSAPNRNGYQGYFLSVKGAGV